MSTNYQRGEDARVLREMAGEQNGPPRTLLVHLNIETWDKRGVRDIQDEIEYVLARELPCHASISIPLAEEIA